MHMGAGPTVLIVESNEVVQRLVHAWLDAAKIHHVRVADGQVCSCSCIPPQQFAHMHARTHSKHWLSATQPHLM